MLFTVGITAYEEEKSIAATLNSILKQLQSDEVEVIVVAGGEDKTLEIVHRFAEQNPILQVIEERKREGKARAINRIFERARGEIIVLTDGDVIVEDGALELLVTSFTDKRVGGACGRVVPINDRNSQFGFWAHFLCEEAHRQRLEASKKGVLKHLTGYLCAVRRGVVEHVPEDALAEDAFLGELVYRRGFANAYVPDARVFVKFPENYRDFLSQKIRTRAGMLQVPRSVRDSLSLLRVETVEGLLRGVRFCKNLRELTYFLKLCVYWRLSWLIAFYELRVRRKSPLEIWQPIPSSKLTA